VSVGREGRGGRRKKRGEKKGRGEKGGGGKEGKRETIRRKREPCPQVDRSFILGTLVTARRV
jgi:hypothetical protein